jgi:hypothetical protein
MIEGLLPINSAGLHALVMRPFLEGSTRLEQAWSGKKILSFVGARLSLKERVVSLVQGALLMVPIINTIIWVAMHTLGEPELTDPYQPISSSSNLNFSDTSSYGSLNACASQRSSPRSLSSTSEPLLPLEPLADSSGCSDISANETAASAFPNALPPQTKTETFFYEESIGDRKFECTWTLNTSPEGAQITKKSNYNNSESRYDADYNLQFLFSNTPEEKKTFQAARTDDGILEVSSNASGREKKEQYLVQNLGYWIQQPILGLKKFLLSDEEEARFFFIDPKSLRLLLGTVRKIREESMNPLGQLLKIETTLDCLRFLHQATFWVDREGIAKVVNSPQFWPLLPRLTEQFLSKDHLAL